MMNKKEYEEQIRELDNNNYDLKVGVLVLSILCIALIFVRICAWDNVDVDDTLGPYMCAQHGLEFEKVESYLMGFGDSYYPDSEMQKLKIYCKHPEPEEKLDDGYLVVIK